MHSANKTALAERTFRYSSMASLSITGNNLASSPVVTESSEGSTTSSKTETLSSQIKSNKASTPMSTASTVSDTASNTSASSASKNVTNNEITSAAFGENNAKIGGFRLAQFIQNIDDYTPTVRLSCGIIIVCIAIVD